MPRLLLVTLYVRINFLIYCRCYKPSIARKCSNDTILIGFSELCSATSVVQTKQHNIKPKNREKDSGFIYSASL